MKYTDIYEACVKFTAGKNLKSIVDLGARHGESYELFGYLHPESKYYFVEPSERCFSHINDIIAKYPQADISLIGGILGLSDGKTSFFQLGNDNDQSGNLFSDRGGQYGEASVYDVKTFDFRKIFKQIDFVKCNIEGGEYQLIDDGFFDIVDAFVMEAHNVHVPNKNYKNVVDRLSNEFELEVWGNVNYKYCFINGQRKK